MEASAYLDADEAAALEHAIREEFNWAGNEYIAVASVLPPAEIARRMGISLKEAGAVREAAKKHVRELWSFEDAAWER